MGNNSHLTLLPSVPVWRDGDLIVFDRKFYDGTVLFEEEWPGKLTCVMSVSNGIPPSFGLIKKKMGDTPFGLKLVNEGEKIAYSHIEGSSVVMSSGDTFDQFHISTMCQQNGIKCVYVIEYIHETRLQILDLDKVNPLVKLRRRWFLNSGESKRRKAFALADGIQANGPAAYYEYNSYKNCMLYYDTRMNQKSLIKDTELHQRLGRLDEEKPLKLAFSGRLIKMKGADHLIQLASILKERKTAFHMTIYGAGDLENWMSQEIEKQSLSDSVYMTGALDFNDELIPDIKENVDVYVILHRQSDPSCTYLETLSCGIPIVGYGNKAFTGLLDQADVGWLANMDDVTGVADIVERLSQNRAEIKEKSVNGIEFARQHDFETTFKNRINHLVDLTE